jgi:uncharacterized protein YjcR
MRIDDLLDKYETVPAKQILIEKYLEQHIKLIDLADELGITVNQAKEWLEENGIPP